MTAAVVDSIGEALRGGPTLSPAQLASVRQARARINLWSGAIRSGKTVASLLRWVMYVRTAPPGGRLVVVGRTKDTVTRNLFSVLQDPAIFGPIADEVKYTPGANVAWIFGRVIDVIGANDARSETRLRGMTCAGAYVDELTLVPREFFTQLLGRMSVPGAMLFATTNPDNPAHFVRKDFILRAAELRLRHWHFTLDDNPTLSPAYREAIKREFVGLFYRRFVLGQWVAAEGAIYDMWDEEKHVVPFTAVPLIDRWIAVGIDYGTTAPFAGELLGLGVDRRLYVVSEYRYDSRQHHRAKTDAEYSTAVRGWLAGVEIPGTLVDDGAGGRRRRRGVTPEAVCVDPSAASFVITLLQDGLIPTKARNSVIDGIRNVATLLATDRLRVVDTCRGLIDEFPGYSWSDKKAQQGIDEPIKADDHCLVAGTPVVTARGQVPIERVRVGDMALTRAGWRAVTDAWQVSPGADVVTVHCSNGATVTGTPNHRVWTTRYGWVRLDALRYGDNLLAWPTALNTSNSTASPTAATPTLNDDPTGCTSPPASPTASEVTAGYTKKSGRPNTDPSPAGTTYTTPTTTRSTTNRLTSCACPPATTTDTTLPNPSGTNPSSNSPTSPTSGLWLPNGTVPTPAMSGTSSTAGEHGRGASRPAGPANGADRTTAPSPATAMSGSAQTHAGPPIAEQVASTTSTEHASNAGQCSAPASTARCGSAPVHVLRITAGTEKRAVYDLTIEGEHEFYAGGILVHNSIDALRYGVHTTEAMWRPYLMETA